LQQSKSHPGAHVLGQVPGHVSNGAGKGADMGAVATGGGGGASAGGGGGRLCDGGRFNVVVQQPG